MRIVWVFFNQQAIVPMKIWTLVSFASCLLFLTHMMACILQETETDGEQEGAILPLKTRNVAAEVFLLL